MGYSQIEHKKKSKRFYITFGSVLFIAALVSAITLWVYVINQTHYGPGPINIEVTSNKPVYLSGEQVNFTIIVCNEHDWPVPYPNSVICLVERDGLYITSIGGGQLDYITLPMFAPHSKTLYLTNFLWNQKMGNNGTLVEPGNYTYSVTFNSDLVNYSSSGKCYFEIGL